MTFSPSQVRMANALSMSGGGGGRPRGLLLLVLGERLAQLRDGDLLLLGREDDLPREDDGHRAGRLAQEVVDGPAEARLNVLDGGRKVGPDLRGALDAE